MKQCKVWEHGAAFYEAVVSRYSGRGGSLGALCHDLFTPLQDHFPPWNRGHSWGMQSRTFHMLFFSDSLHSVPVHISVHIASVYDDILINVYV